MQVDEAEAAVARVLERVDHGGLGVNQVSRMRVDDLAVDQQLELALEDVERVDVLPVDVRGRAGGPRLHVEFEHDELLARDEDGRLPARSLEDFHVTSL